MKLGIAVVYLVREGNEALLALHLDRLARHTDVPHAIYGAVNRLARPLREALARRPGFAPLEPPAAAGGPSEEHAQALEACVAAALADACTHVALFHVDSFPVRDGWAGELAAALSPERPFAAAVRDARLDAKPFTAFALARADFLAERRPRLLLSEAERASAAYRRYRRRCRHHPDSGVGWGLLAFRDGLDWLRLPRSNRGADHPQFGSVYGDVAFHLGAAAWARKDVPGTRGPSRVLDLRARLGPLLGAALPAAARERLKRLAGRAIPALDIERKYAANERAHEAVRRRLLADPDAYLRYLRFG